MLAVLGGDERWSASSPRSFGLTVANDNAPGQLVLSGAAEAIGEARGAAARRRRQGDPPAGRRRLPLAADGRRRAAASATRSTQIEFRQPQAAGLLLDRGRALRGPPRRARRRADRAGALARDPAAHARDGAATFLETGPGDVLTGLVRRTLDDVEARSLAEPEAVHA